MADEIMVSILCLTYNHEMYVRDALESFIMQKTSFPFEVIIHDDASTDHTAAIIREYESKYPNIIKLICQIENQYSKGIRIEERFLFPRVHGKYVALCEGDDYWTDPDKLQLQVEYMEEHPEVSACVHNTRFYYCDRDKEIVRYPTRDRELDMIDVALCGGQSFHTSSLLYRSDYIRKQADFCYAVPGVSDYPLAIYLSMKGRIHYLGKEMSYYRCGTANSWTKRMSCNYELEASHCESLITMLKMANAYSGYRYDEIFKKAIQANEYKAFILRGNFHQAIRSPYFKTLSFKKRAKTVLRTYFPFLRGIRKSIHSLIMKR